MATLTIGTSGVTPRPIKQATGENYIALSAMNFDNSFELPEVLEKEVERFGKRTISGFLSMVGAEMPLQSDRVVWSEQGRLHAAFTVTVDVDDQDATDGATIAADGAVSGATQSGLLAVGQTIIITKGTAEVKGRIKSVDTSAGTFGFEVYGATDASALGTGDVAGCKMFIFGSEYAKGSGASSAPGQAVEPDVKTFSNKPIILRDHYNVDASNLAQIGWIEVTTEAGASGYLWYMKAESEARLRFMDHIEMAMIEAEAGGSGAGSAGAAGFEGMEGLFAAIESRGIQYSGTDFDGAGGLSQFDDLLAELDKQGSIEENMLFLDRAKSLEIDNMLAAQNSYGAGGTSYGVFENDENMALNLGFSGFRRGSYDFYKTDWKYLNDSTTRGFVGGIEGVLVPAGTSSVYDETLGQNISRPFLHVRYRANANEDRRMKSWVTGSAGGNFTSAEDVMRVHYLSERTLCTLAANNFVLFK
tara:strand:- start:3021 stop:4442 length:1422 start_codon:yes stop_codon:yes gene_type:complete